MKIWTAKKKNAELDDVAVAKSFWESEFGRVAGEKCYPLDTMLERFLASEYDAVVWNDHQYAILRATVLHNWPKEWR